MARRKKNYRKKAMYHPSITSLAGSLVVGNFINSGYDPASSITNDLADGDFRNALHKFMMYTPALVTSTKGRTALTKGVGVAVLGGAIRKVVPNVRLGFGKYYAKI